MKNENHKLSNKYNSKEFEEKIYEQWEENGYFKPSEDKNKKPYCIVMPPPNVTGKLHMGHALDDTIQDVLIRYKRMAGYNTLWLPGTDHSAISTEAKVVAKLKQEGKTKYELGREGFLKEAWAWKEKYGNEITNQIRKLGCSCDWSRQRFTMDEGLSKAVVKQFVDLYNKGLIYKGKRMVNWCTNCNTSISDVEVEYEEEKTKLWHIKYQIVGSDKSVVVATTRPETMLGDVAVAVHPSDERYVDVIGKKVILPIMNKEIPIIADPFVEKEFGTGAVKITPAHDMNDYQAGLRHQLEVISVFDENFKMGALVPEYEGMDIYTARKAIVEKLKELNVLVKEEDYIHNVGKCQRCHSTIEPTISDQWFVKMKNLVKPAIQAVKDGDIKFVPDRFSKIYFHWMENIQDWCISRQIWWGHRIPAYYCDDCGEIIVEEQMPQKCDKCKGSHFTQEEDTLDTWFSSALWPFSTLGWPDKTEDLQYFYPTNTLVTAYDIITFWVSRMIVSGFEFMKQKPFDDVFIHGIVRDAEGRKMSKSLGNGIDPLEIIEKYGTDALRFSLILGISPGNDIRYMPEKLEAASNFANKLWNASKFVLMNLEDIQEFKEVDIEEVNLNKLIYADKWIISRGNRLIKEVTENLDKFELGIATQKIYDFIRNDFCDWYIEMVKPRLFNQEDKSRYEVQYVLNRVLCVSLQLLHPIMPFMTEEIYQKLYHQDTSIMISKWPKYRETLNFKQDEQYMNEMMEIVRGIRNLRANMNIPLSKKTKLIFVTTQLQEIVERSKPFLYKFGYSDEIIIQENKQNIPNTALSIISKNVEVYIPFEDLVNVKEEKQRLEEEREKLVFEVQRATKMLSNQGFVSKAPQTKIQEEKEKLENYKHLLELIEEKIKGLQ